MKISRLDLDGTGSPAALVTRILEVEKDLPIPVPLEELCERLDIVSIADLETEGFEAALLTDQNKSSGAILIASGRSRQRRRFSTAHELGHFLIPTHLPGNEGQILCSARDLLTLEVKEQNRRQRMEVEANRFASLLLMPPPVLRLELRRSTPDLAHLIRLSRQFDVSKEAMARAYSSFHPSSTAIIIVRNGRVLRLYREARKFPWIDVAPGSAVPADSIFHDGCEIGAISENTPCEPEVWLSFASARSVAAMTEQIHLQRNGFALIMLHAEMIDDEDLEFRREDRPPRF